MNTLTILTPSAVLLSVALVIVNRVRTRHTSPKRTTPKPEIPESLPHDSTLAGTPLRELLSDQSGPGAVLRDGLLTRPSSRDP